MKDRKPTQPGRVKITPEDGSPAYFANMEMADEPLEIGTPLNKSTLLSDATALLFEKNETATPDEIFVLISKALKEMGTSISGIESLTSGIPNKLSYETGSFYGPGRYKPITIQTNLSRVILCIFSTEEDYDSNVALAIMPPPLPLGVEFEERAQSRYLNPTGSGGYNGSFNYTPHDLMGQYTGHLYYYMAIGPKG